LELFYYVARHGGIMPAVRNIPYGIQQPAVSAQVAQLEAFLGVTLFQRRPFALTAEGEKLFAFIQPFFTNLDRVAAEFQGGQARQIRIGASTIILRDHLPGLLADIRRRFAGLRILLREGYPVQLEAMLLKDEIDVALTMIGRKPAAGIHSALLLELPMVLLVEKRSPIQAAEDLWRRDRIEEPLICLPGTESLTRAFLARLQILRVDWFPAIEASSADLIETYVASGLGVGVSVQVPAKPWSKNVRALPLTDFPRAQIGAMWRGKKTAWLDAFLDMARQRARELI
jgi:DNA-binding transcriptional LysR family regulator